VYPLLALLALPLVLTAAHAQAAPAPADPAATPAPAATVPAAPPTAPPATSPAAPAAAAPAPAAAPKVPRFSRTPIGSCDCALYAPPGMPFAAPERSEDGAEVWTGETHQDGWTYGVVAVRFAEPFTDSSPQDLEDLLVSYMDFLRSQSDITADAGVGRGHTHSENAAARGVIDYWQGSDGDQWALKGWVDAHHLAVLYIAGPGEYPWFSAQQMYLDGFRFTAQP